MVTRAFPTPGRLVEQAYRELAIAANGSTEQRRVLGGSGPLGRPFDPPSCTQVALRRQVWAWLDEVAAWVNHEYAWTVDRLIPPCWPAHPHIGHELAVLADQRRTAGLALASDGLEEWHRNTLPAFLERVHARLGPGCVTGHGPWPAAARNRAYGAGGAVLARRAWFEADLTHDDEPGSAGAPQLALVDIATGELTPVTAPNGGR